MEQNTVNKASKPWILIALSLLGAFGGYSWADGMGSPWYAHSPLGVATVIVGIGIAIYLYMKN